MSKLQLAVLASGSGSNLQAILDACKNEEINAEVNVVVSNKKSAYALVRAREAEIETLLFDPIKYKTRTEVCAKMAKSLKERGVELVCLAGYMLKLEPCMVRSFPNKIINVHPSLLPKYGGKGMYGHHVHEAVLAAGEKESGCTIHLVDEIFDHGAVLAQDKIAIEEGETPESLANKIHPLEHKLYVSVLKEICDGSLDLNQVAKEVNT